MDAILGLGQHRERECGWLTSVVGDVALSGTSNDLSNLFRS